MTRRTARLITGLAFASALSACANSGPIYSTFRSEAGALKAADGFGDITAHNTAVMTGQMGYTVDLAKRFAEEIPDTVNFAFNSAVLDAGAKQILRRQADWISQFPEVRFRVFGHTDLVGDARYNKSLGLRRANAVVNYLVSLGIERSRLEAVVSHGETQPLIQTTNRERLNRRALTDVSGIVTGHPSLLNGQYAAVVYRGYVESAAVPTTLTSEQTTVSPMGQ